MPQRPYAYFLYCSLPWLGIPSFILATSMSDSAVIAYEEIKRLLLLGFNGVTYNTTQMANLLLLKKRVYQTIRIKLRVNQWEKMTNFIKWPARSCAWSYWKTRDKISVKGPYTVVWTGLERTAQLRKISAKWGKDRKHLRKGKVIRENAYLMS